MAELGHLPSELVSGICSYVSSDDFHSLRQVSKHIKALADSYLVQHQRLQGELTPIEIHGIWPSPRRDTQPLLGILNRIIRSPSHATYIHALSIYRWPTSYRKYGEDGDAAAQGSAAQVIRQRKKDTADFLDNPLAIEAIRDLGHLSTAEFGDWIHATRTGQEATLLSVLVLLSPNLRTLRMTRIESLADAFTDAFIYAATNPQAGFLSRLTTVHMSFWDRRASFCLLLALMRLPAIKVLHCYSINIGDQYNSTHARKLIPFSSTLVELSLREHWLSTDSICGLLDFCPQLKILEATYRIDYLDRLPRPETVSTVFRNLEVPTKCSKTVERLVYREHHCLFYEYKHFFHSFPCLLELEIDFRITQLSAQLHGVTETFTSMPPWWLQKLVVRYEQSETPHLDSLLLEISKFKPQRLPNLTQVHFQRIEEPSPRAAPYDQPAEYRGNQRVVLKGNSVFTLAQGYGCLAVGVLVTSD